MSDADITFNTKEFEAALSRINFNVDDFQKIGQKGETVLIEGMKSRAAVASGDMKNSIKGHVVEANIEQIVNEVGPEVDYAVYQEYGTGIYAENGQGRKTPWVYRAKNDNFYTTHGNRPHPFVRPTVIEDGDKAVTAMEKEFQRYILTKWLK